MKKKIDCCALITLSLCVFTAQAFAQDTVSANANRYETALIPIIETTLSSRVDGNIKDISVREGESFAKDKVLVSVDCDLHIAELQRTQAELRGAKEVYAARQKLDKLKSVGKLDVTLSAVEVDKLEADRKQKQKLVDNCKITAPFDGVVTESLAQPHQNVKIGEPLLKIMDTTAVKLEFFVPSSAIAKFTPGLTLNLYINETGQNYKATLVSVVPRIDPVSQTFKVIGRIDSSEKSMLAGMSGYVTLPGDEPVAAAPTATVAAPAVAPAPDAAVLPPVIE